MAVPKKKTSPSKRDMRRSHHALVKSNAYACASCGEPTLPHCVCPHCNNYKGKSVVASKD
jgi:large subunit ribosomal protein L32